MLLQISFMKKVLLIFITGVIFFSCTRNPVQTNYAKKVNVFLATETKTPVPNIQLEENLPRFDTTWFDVRELNGATHPGATQPFGMVSCSPSSMVNYKKGYPSGYNGNEFLGLSHFHQSGTGTIRWYYNYILFTPQTGDWNSEKIPQKIIDQQASPGWYSCKLKSGIEVETTVAKKSAMHQYTFPSDGKKHLLIDVCHYLVALDSARVQPNNFPENISIKINDNKSASGYVLMDGLPIWFVIQLDTKATVSSIFSNNSLLSEKNFVSKNNIKNTGILFYFDEGKQNQVKARIGFSFKSLEQANTNLQNDFSDWDFEKYKTKASSNWNNLLSTILVEDSNTDEVNLFYSSMYKALLKPAFLEAENPFWKSDNYWTDFATFWDIYSTQLPFVFTFFPEYGEKITQFYFDLSRQFGGFQPAYLMKKTQPWVFSKQASALGGSIFSDALNKELITENKNEILAQMVAELHNERGVLFQKEIPLAPSRTHNVDYSYAAFCTSQFARKLGKAELADSLLQMTDYWKPMFDENGILIDNREVNTTEDYPKQWFNFYEGNKWNYTFKVYHDMKALMELQGGEKQFLQNLDWYFNLSTNDTENQFQGLNNEVDYTVPYCYLYAGRPDRTQQIIRVALEYRFHNTAGGYPGNEDSGAMSSWYCWNSMGLFPISGQDIFLIGSPLFEKVSFAVHGNEFSIITKNNSKNNIYIQSATLNGEPYNKAYLHFKDLEKGGEIVFEMGDKPSEWGAKNRPPSYGI